MDIRVLRDVPVTLRDGTCTTAEIWLPDDGGQHPSILVRTPYLKETAAPTAVVDTRVATSRGYAVVLQDVRGTGLSGGQFTPFVNEEGDGADTVRWVCDQAWSNGRVVMAGGSYVGATQWLAAAGAPQGFCAIAPTLSSDEFGADWSYRAGVLEHGFITSWCAAVLAPVAERLLEDVERAWNDPARVIRTAPWLRDWIENPPGSPYWQRISASGRHDQIAIPVVAVAGWYDIFLMGTIRSFERARNPWNRLIIGPWAHADSLSHLVGDADLGFEGEGAATLFGWLIDFYDDVLADRPPRLPRVRAYVLGARRWVDLEEWPPRDGEPWTVPTEPGDIPVDSERPVPSLGGRALLVGVPRGGLGPVDQRELLARGDVLVAVDTLLERDVLLAGPVSVALDVSARGGESDPCYWVATLAVEHEDGRLYNLAEGIAKADSRETCLTIELGDVCAWLSRRKRLVLLLAGSSFPRWSRPTSNRIQHASAGALRLTIAPETAALL
jgi:uncharacterized protein